MPYGQLDWGIVKRLFAEARAQPEDQREVWLTNAGADPAEVAEVRSLIDSLQHAGNFLEEPRLLTLRAAVGPLQAEPDPARRFATGAWLGRYEIVELLGAGGMGEVYRDRHAAGSNGGDESAADARGRLSRVAGASGA